jgi:hypothetical protein
MRRIALFPPEDLQDAITLHDGLDLRHRPGNAGERFSQPSSVIAIVSSIRMPISSSKLKS